MPTGAADRLSVRRQQPADLHVAVTGEAATMKALIELVASARAPQKPNDTIMFTSQGAWRVMSDRPELRQWGVATSHAALERGWNIRTLRRLDGSVHRSLRVVESTLNFLGAGGVYQQFYFARYGLLVPPYDLAIVPGVGALVAFSTASPSTCDAAVHVRDPQQIKVLQTHFAMLTDLAKPLLTPYSSRERLAFETVVAEVEQKPGDRFLVDRTPPSVTYPPSWYQGGSWRRSTRMTEADLSQSLDLQRQRLEAFRTQSQTHRFRDILSKPALQELVDTLEYPSPQGASASEPLRVTPDECREHLTHIGDLLLCSPNYELALADENEQDLLSPMYWEVKGETVFMETPSHDNAGKPLTLFVVISEPTVARAFREYFEDLWDRISPRSKDKNLVLGWLRHWIELLARRTDGD